MSQKYIRLQRNIHGVYLWGTEDKEIKEIIEFSKKLFPTLKIAYPIKGSPQYYCIEKINKKGENLFLEILKYLLGKFHAVSAIAAIAPMIPAKKPTERSIC